MGQRYTLEDLMEIVETLRGENGCLWDKEQTHRSLKPYMMEEAAELVSSIRIFDTTGNAENMREELGDVLFHVVLHSQIAKEEGLFTFEDVVQEISEKMVRRHPRVFIKEGQAGEADGEIPSWDEIKRKEKEGKEWIISPLREEPGELPALVRAVKVMRKADKLYGAGRDYQTNVERIQEAAAALADIRPEEEAARLEEVMGDILTGLADLVRQRRISLEQILTDRTESLIEHYEPMENPEK